MPKLALPSSLIVALLDYLTLLCHCCGCLDMHQQPWPALPHNNRQPVIVANVPNPRVTAFRSCCCFAAQQQVFLMPPPFSCDYSRLSAIKSNVCLPEPPFRSIITCNAQQLLPTRPPPRCCYFCPAPLLRNQVIIVIFTNFAAVNWLFVSAVLVAAAFPVKYMLWPLYSLCAASIATKQLCCQHLIVASSVGVVNCRFFRLVFVVVVINLFSSLSSSFAERHALSLYQQ